MTGGTSLSRRTLGQLFVLVLVFGLFLPVAAPGGIEDAFRDKKIVRAPASLNYDVPDVYLVETDDGLMALNMGDTAKKVNSPGGVVEIPARSLARW